MIYSMNRMAFQFDYLGGSTPQNLGLLVCQRCTDDLNYQQKLLILPPDPAPIANTRPEPYAVDETNWLTTQDGDIFVTTDGAVPYVTPVPTSPSVNPDMVVLNTVIAAPAASVAVMYMDFFIGNPTTGAARSVLASITGTATRTNIASALEINGQNQAVNPAPVVVTSAMGNVTVNVEYVGFYDAPTGGTLLMSGPVSATWPTLTPSAQVQFNGLGILIQL